MVYSSSSIVMMWLVGCFSVGTWSLIKSDEACDGDDNDLDGSVDEGFVQYADMDGDGFGDPAAPVVSCDDVSGLVLDDGDCDDGDASVNPAAAEVCDSADNNCDGVIDDDAIDATTYYTDEDGDGFGDEGTRGLACEVPSGVITVGGDCDDGDASVNPDAAEVCDGVDNNCDDLTDNDAIDATTYYADEDGDGFGDPAALVLSCEDVFLGLVLDDSDCDDGDASVNPDALELCSSGADEDCDGSPAPCGVEGALAEGDADYTILGDAGTSLGYDLTAGDLNGDGEDDLVVSAYQTDVSSSLTEAGAVYVVYGPIAADLSLPDDADLTMNGVDASDFTGWAISAEGDVNGDGVDDLLISAPIYYNPDSRSRPGGVALVYGSTSARRGSLTFSSGDALWAGPGPNNYFGTAAQIIGDFNGDGYDDIVIGGSGVDLEASSSGGVYLFAGSPTKFSGSMTTSTAAVTISGVAGGDYLGDLNTVSGRIDLNGDGLCELVLGAIRNNDAGSAAGAVYLIYGNGYDMDMGGLSVTANYADAVFTGDNAGDSLGRQGSGVGDTDGDGYDELIAGGYAADPGGVLSAGCAWLLPGGSTPYSGKDSINTYATAEFCGVAISDFIGELTYGGDLNGDAYADVVVASSGVNVGSTFNAGAAYVFFGPVSGSYLTRDADASLSGSNEYGYMGLGGTSMDYDGDGADDLLIGAWGIDAAYVWRGGGL